MPATFHLSEDAEAKLDRMVEEGGYDDRTEAVREALNLLREAQEMRKRGDRPLLLSDRDLEKLGEGVETITAVSV